MRRLYIASSVVCMLLIMASCSIAKYPQGRTIEGNYTISRIEKLETNACELICILIDKRSHEPIANASVRIYGLNMVQFTNEKGVVKFDIPEGRYRFEAMNTGNTTINTDFIEFKSGSRTEVKFDLGSTIIYCY